VKGKLVVIGLFAATAIVAGASLYLRATIKPVDQASETSLSPDKQRKTVTFSLWSNGKEPFCYHTVAVLPARLPDHFAVSEKTYQVYFARCAVPHDPANEPAVEWTAANALRITYTPPPGGFSDTRFRRRAVDASRSVDVSYVARGEGSK
jgi:hypothetical protein